MPLKDKARAFLQFEEEKNGSESGNRTPTAPVKAGYPNHWTNSEWNNVGFA